MCAAISAAATAAASLSGEVDARGFYGNNLCSAANITEMLNPLTQRARSPGKRTHLRERAVRGHALRHRQHYELLLYRH